jgi:3-deoxy-D-manno-octulosonic-acid transferase
MLLYRALARIAVPVVPLVLRDEHQRAAHRARIGAPGALEQWARAHRDPTRPLGWFHASSVGEGLQARAILDELRLAMPDMQFIYTHFSPSAEAFAASIAADWSGYLCYDRGADIQRMLTAAAPDLLVFTKVDLWPELAARAALRGTRVALAAGTVSAASGRVKWPVRQLAAPGYAALHLAMAISDDDARRLEYLGCASDRIVVTGDPRVDSVLQVAEGTSRDTLLRGTVAPARTLVAGSTWPEDEAVVLAAFDLVRERHAGARLIIAPHQPTAGQLQRIDAVARELGLPEPVRFSRLAAGEPPPIVSVDRTGVLAAHYGAGCMAYVGGGWGSNGIHSVLEPAAWGSPVVIGPHDRGNRDVRQLATVGALRQLREPANPRELAAIWMEWLDQPEKAQGAGRAGRALLEAGRGAARQSADLLRGLLTARSPIRG